MKFHNRKTGTAKEVSFKSQVIIHQDHWSVSVHCLVDGEQPDESNSVAFICFPSRIDAELNQGDVLKEVIELVRKKLAEEYYRIN